MLKFNKHNEPFFILDQNQCNNSLVTDGIKFYIFKYKQPYIKNENPLVFNTLEDAEKYRKEKECTKTEIINLLVKKDLKDPQENYERQCNKEYASYFNKVNNWGTLLDKNPDSKLVKKCVNIKNNVDTDSQIENCIRKKLSSDELKKKLFYF